MKKSRIDNRKRMKRLSNKAANRLIDKSVIWHDVLVVLKTMAQRPLQLTVKKNLTRNEINYLGSKFQNDIYHRDEKGDIMWPIWTEAECWYLLKIRALIQVMSLGRNYKRTYRITNKGREFLRERMVDQFSAIWIDFVTRFNWEYVHPAMGNRQRVAIVLQQHFPEIAHLLLSSSEWVDMRLFAKQLAKTLSLMDDPRDLAADYSFIHSDIERILIEEMSQFNLVEVKREVDKYGFQRIRRFRLNRLGRDMLDWLPSPAGLPALPKAISVTMHYQGELQLLLNKSSETLMASEGLPFLLLLKMWFDTYPQVMMLYPPGTLGLSLNGNPPDDLDILNEGDVVSITVAKKRKWVN